MIETDIYYTIKQPISFELPKVKGSRFLAEVYPLADILEVEIFLDAVRKREQQATHHCYAYRMQDTNNFRANDDGEPSGTAGMPILRQIDKRELSNCLIVVSRYYGGTKLGTGGLIRAYGDAAAAVLAAAEIVENVCTAQICLIFDYPDTSLAMHSLKTFEAQIMDLQYADKTMMQVKVRLSQEELLKETFLKLLQGRGIVMDS